MTVLKRIIGGLAILLMLNMSVAGNLWAAKNLAAVQDTVTKTTPEDHAASTRKLPEGEKGFWGKYKWWVIGGLVVVAGGAAAGGGGGGGGSSNGGDTGGEDASVTVGW